MGSSPGESLPQRAAAVGFGATAPHARALVRGREARGVPGTVFNPMTGRGWVSPKDGNYAGSGVFSLREWGLFFTFTR